MCHNGSTDGVYRLSCFLVWRTQGSILSKSSRVSESKSHLNRFSAHRLLAELDDMKVIMTGTFFTFQHRNICAEWLSKRLTTPGIIYLLFSTLGFPLERKDVSWIWIRDLEGKRKKTRKERKIMFLPFSAGCWIQSVWKCSEVEIDDVALSDCRRQSGSDDQWVDKLGFLLRLRTGF